MKKFLLIAVALIVVIVAAALLFFKGDAKNPYQETRWGKFSGSCASEDMPDKDYGKKFHS